MCKHSFGGGRPAEYKGMSGRKHKCSKCERDVFVHEEAHKFIGMVN